MLRFAGLALLAGCLVPLDQTLEPRESDRFDEHFRTLGHVPVVEIELDDRAWEDLQTDPRSYTDGYVRIDGIWHVAEVRLKGGGSFRPIEARPSLKVRFADDWHGYRRLVFNNYVSDESKLHERLATEAFHHLGLPAARAGHAEVRINSMSRGVYGVLEEVDSDMLRYWFPDSSGPLYELEDGDFTEEGLAGIEHDDGPEVPELLEHIAADLAAGDAAGFSLASEHFMRHQFISYWATVAVLGQTDAFPYSRPGDDAYLYLDPETDRFHFVPHGLDEAFMPRGRTLSFTTGLLARRCLTDLYCRNDFEQRVWSVFDELAENGAWLRMVDGLLEHSKLWRTPAEQERMARHDEVLLGWLDRRVEQLLREF